MNKIEQIKELKALLESGAINDGQYNQLLNEIISGKSYQEQPTPKIEDSIGEKAKLFAPGMKNNEDQFIINTEDKELLLKLPYVIAYPLQQTLLEKNAPQRLNYFRDTFLNYLKYLGLLTASEFFNSPFKERKIVDLFFKNLIKPSLGHWNAFTRDCLTYLKTQNHSFFCPDLFDYYENVETGKKIKMYNGEIEVVDSYNGGAIRYIKQPLTAIGILINFRNRLYHTPTIDIATSEKLWNDYFPIFRTLLEQLTFCEKFPMLKQETGVYYSLQGIEIKPFESKINIDSNVAIYNSDTITSMPIIPFFIIPGELAIESDEIANILSYESNNGKTITFFSPEGITKQTSGKILERLNLLLRDKQKEITYTPENFTKDIFAARIAEENELMLKSLLNEKKVIEGIYQHREEIEIKLREWIGARANIFFIAAEAGSGKTNLLVEMQRQYAERNLMSLFIRASRMEKKSLKEELCYQLNMDFSLDIAQYTSLAGTQEDPFFILIDGLNESSHAESFWQEILEISAAFEPGSLKFIITSRANTKADLERYAVTEEQTQYLYGENKDHLKSLSGFAFWLTPLDMKEMESTWDSYIANDRNRFKPLFSFNDIATFDRGLYLQINNPLVLRIFLETYKGKNLPKKGTKHLHVWKDWFATFSNEEQKFMNLLADAVWEHGENELLLDDVLNNKNLQSYFLNDNSSAPYLRLLTLGWISRYVKDLIVYVSFTVEGLLLYLLGAKLNQQNPALISNGIGEILNNGTKLQKSAIESFLCEQALQGEIDLITQLIDEGEEKLELCVTPLLYFLKSQGVEKTIEKLLENPTENDWKILLELNYELLNLEFFGLRKTFLLEIKSKNNFVFKESILLGLECVDSINIIKDARIYFEEFENKINLKKCDKIILFKLGEVFIKLWRYDEAIELFNNSIEFYKDIFDLSRAYSRIGIAHYEKQEFELSIKSYFKSLNLYKSLILNNSLGDVASIYNNIGSSYYMLSNYNLALDYYEKSKVILQQKYGDRNIHLIQTKINIGKVSGEIGQFEFALGILFECLESSLITFGPNFTTMNATVQISIILDKLTDNGIILSYLIKQLEIFKKLVDNKSSMIADNYNCLGKVYKRINNNEMALHYYLLASELNYNLFGIDDSETEDSVEKKQNCLFG
jgi:tetratricopeptide (TPR) repeat protein